MPRSTTASGDPVDQSLRYVRAISERLRDDLVVLPPAGWDAPTNCPPWPVRRLVAHVVSSGEAFRLSVERGVAGVTEPPLTEEERARRMDELADATPTERIEALERVTNAIEALYARLGPEDLDQICYHRRGNRSARWYAQHRLAEVAFHAWDLRRSLGQEAVLDEDVAHFLLPTLLESNLPRIYPSGPGGEGHYRLTVTGEPAASWRLTASPDRLAVERNGGDADVTITAPAATLALLVYGRADLAEEERQGRARVDGDRTLAERFHTIFPGP